MSIPESHTINSASVKGENLDSKPNSKDKKPKVTAINGGREVSDRILYAGNLHKSVDQEQLVRLFQTYIPSKVSKVLNDKNNPEVGYAFIEFNDSSLASKAKEEVDGYVIQDVAIKLNWAFRSSNANSVQSSLPVYNIFVGDLSPNVNDETLYKHFSEFPSIREAHVMWDMKTLRSRGYGFVTFLDQHDAERAVDQMNGKVINGRSIRCNRASHKSVNNKPKSRAHFQSQNFPPSNFPPPNFQSPNYAINSTSMAFNGLLLETSSPFEQIPTESFEQILSQSPNWVTTVYLGNFPNFIQQADVLPIVSGFGYIIEFKFYTEKRCAFITYDTHERAALAINQLSGLNLHGRPLKCGWGHKSRH